MRGGALELVPRCMVSLFVAFILLQRIPVCTEWAGARPRTVVQTGRVNGGHCPCLSNGRGQGDRAIALPTSDFQDLLSWRDPPELDKLCALFDLGAHDGKVWLFVRIESCDAVEIVERRRCGSHRDS